MVRTPTFCAGVGSAASLKSPRQHEGRRKKLCLADNFIAIGAVAPLDQREPAASFAQCGHEPRSTIGREALLLIGEARELSVPLKSRAIIIRGHE